MRKTRTASRSSCSLSYDRTHHAHSDPTDTYCPPEQRDEDHAARRAPQARATQGAMEAVTLSSHCLPSASRTDVASAPTTATVRASLLTRRLANSEPPAPPCSQPAKRIPPVALWRDATMVRTRCRRSVRKARSLSRQSRRALCHDALLCTVARAIRVPDDELAPAPHNHDRAWFGSYHAKCPRVRGHASQWTSQDSVRRPRFCVQSGTACDCVCAWTVACLWRRVSRAERLRSS